jgi:replicative DNA helicase
MNLPSSTKEQQALIGILVNDACCHSPDALIECERLGVNESHFVDPERTLWLEIVKADRELRPFDLVSLRGHLERTRNGDGIMLSTHLSDCAAKNEAVSLKGAIACLQNYAKTLMTTKLQRDAHNLGQELTKAAKSGDDSYLEVIEKIAVIGQTYTGKGFPRIVNASDLCAKPPPPRQN